MPEVIEVLKYADFLSTKLKNKEITEINVLNGRYKKHGDFEHLDSLRNALPQKVIDIETKGKFLYITKFTVFCVSFLNYCVSMMVTDENGHSIDGYARVSKLKKHGKLLIKHF